MTLVAPFVPEWSRFQSGLSPASRSRRSARAARPGRLNHALPPSQPHYLCLSKDIRVPLPVVYERWMQFGAVPHFMRVPCNETRFDESRAVWKIALAGTEILWHAELGEAVPEQRIAWQSAAQCLCPNAGGVSFEELGRQGTRITVDAEFEPGWDSVGPDGSMRKLASRLESALEAFRAQVEAPSDSGSVPCEMRARAA